jgi:predicted tellurium resistance membrane protein TerC
MNADNAKLGHASAGFAMAVSITALFSTALAWAKDAYKPLNSFMNAVAWHNWITHGLADLILFIGLGLIFSKTNWAGGVPPNRLISVLVVAVVVAGAGLFVWYAVF